jgi:2-hydroxychromene-2-carboxylate isomerase
MKPIDFWYSIGSTYTYLTVLRISKVATENDVTFNWRPFNVRSLMIEQNNIPFANKPSKMAYMWRDIERRAGKYGIPAVVPAPYPLKDLALANQVALLGMREGWGEAYTVETYRRWFVDGQPAGSEPNLSESLRYVGRDPARVIRDAQSPEIVEDLGAETLAARNLGVFGAPSFIVDGEIFWGDDRLEDAIRWHKQGRLGA